MVKLQVLKVFNASLAYLLLLLFFVVIYRSPIIIHESVLSKSLYFIFLNLLPAIVLIFVSLFSKSKKANVAVTIIAGCFILINSMIQGIQLGYID